MTFVGFPFSFDARSLSTNAYVIDALSLEAQLTSSTTVHSYQLMAANGYTMQIAAGVIARIKLARAVKTATLALFFR